MMHRHTYIKFIITYFMDARFQDFTVVELKYLSFWVVVQVGLVCYCFRTGYS